MKYNLTPNKPCDMDATKRVFACYDARWEGIKENSIDVIERIKRQRKQMYKQAS